MKIGIITICGPLPNYGNKLQNYAVQYVYNKLGYETETYQFVPSMLTLKSKIRYLIHQLTNFRYAKDKEVWAYDYKKNVSFERFTKKYISTYKCSVPNEIRKRCDFYSVGSDQVWNTNWFGENDNYKEFYLLSFAEEKQRICFSPSFGFDELPSEWTKYFSEQLKKFPYVSVREEKGAEIVKAVAEKNAMVLIDPSMMLSKKEWKMISKNPKMLNTSTKYLLTYFLGYIPEQAKKTIDNLVKENGYKVYNLMEKENPYIYTADPGEFIWLIENAEIIFTDSFHACVFSFLFEKPFLVYARQGTDINMMSRINTFLNKFGLQRKYVDSGLENAIFETDYTEGLQILEKERKKVYLFLEKSLAGKG